MKKNIVNTLLKSEESFRKWKNIPFEERQKLFSNLASELLKNKEKLASIITKEMNKPISQSISEIEKCAGMTSYYSNVENNLKIKQVETDYEISEIHYEPLGVILGVMPWNFPFWQVLRFAIPTILAGNTAIVKHASICLESGDTIQKLFEQAGFPVDIFTHLEVSHYDIEKMIEHPVIKAVSLTGSEAAGKKIAEIAGRNLKKCVLELGGNDAFIVLKDADLDKAAKDAALARLQNCGQTCVAGKRFIIHSDIYDVFLEKFITEYKKYLPKNSNNEDTILSGMARKDLASDLENQYKKAIENGAKVLLPLKKISEIEFEPGLIEMNENNPILDEELFGPLGMVLRANDDNHALRLANNTQFGLANAVYTKNKEQALHFAKELESGNVAINQIFRSDWKMPFGGRKNSGYGTELSLYALEEFTIKKSIIGGY